MVRLPGMALLTCCAIAAGCGRSPGDLTQPPVTFRWVYSGPSPNLIEGTLMGTNERVYVQKDWIIAGEDLEYVMDMPDKPDESGKPAIAMKFTPTGQAKMQRASEEGDGRRVALVVDGEIICAIPFKGPMKEDAIINGAFSQEQAARIAKRMQECRAKK